MFSNFVEKRVKRFSHFVEKKRHTFCIRGKNVKHNWHKIEKNETLFPICWKNWNIFELWWKEWNKFCFLSKRNETLSTFSRKTWTLLASWKNKSLQFFWIHYFSTVNYLSLWNFCSKYNPVENYFLHVCWSEAKENHVLT